MSSICEDPWLLVAPGSQWFELGEALLKNGDDRPADISAATTTFGFVPTVATEDCLAKHTGWAREELRGA